MPSLFHQLLPLALPGLLAILLTTKSTATITLAKPGCQTQCGNITVPYPFGIGLDGACSMGEWYNINCNTSYEPPKAFLEATIDEIFNISLEDSEMRVDIYMTSRCYKDQELLEGNRSDVNTRLKTTPCVVSNIANKFFVIGCDDYGVITGEYGENDYAGGAISMCDGPENVINGSFSGSGCSQTSLPKGLKGFKAELGRVNQTNVSDFNKCRYPFVGEYSKYTFDFSDLSDSGIHEPDEAECSDCA